MHDQHGGAGTSEQVRASKLQDRTLTAAPTRWSSSRWLYPAQKSLGKLTGSVHTNRGRTRICSRVCLQAGLSGLSNAEWGSKEWGGDSSDRKEVGDVQESLRRGGGTYLHQEGSLKVEMAPRVKARHCRVPL